MRISDWSSDVCSSDLIRVTASYTRGLEPVTGDRVQLQQVIVNLLINAFQAVESQEVANRKILLATGIEEDNSVYLDRKSVVEGKSVSVRVDLGVRGIIKNKRNNSNNTTKENNN